MGELATSADVIAYLERLKTNAEKVADNSAAGPEGSCRRPTGTTCCAGCWTRPRIIPTKTWPTSWCTGRGCWNGSPANCARGCTWAKVHLTVRLRRSGPVTKPV